MAAVPAKLDQIAAHYTDGRQYTLDGLSVEYPDWHFNVRAVEYRATAAAEPRGDDSGSDGGKTRRGAQAHTIMNMQKAEFRRQNEMQRAECLPESPYSLRLAFAEGIEVP